MDKPLLSIIIPTKNRYTTLFPVVDMILSFDLNHEIEIVIQDNSENNQEALTFVEERNQYSNIGYFHENTPLSVIQNSDKAVLNSTGEYVCFIGDDDGVMPNIIEVVKWMKQKGVNALRSIKPQYYWPNQQSSFLSKDVSGILKTFRQYKNTIDIKKTKDALSEVLHKGGTVMGDLPCLYHGIVNRETLNIIYDKTGTFFPGPSPDMANAIALSLVLDTYAHANFPVIISGKSAKSTGGAGVLHKHIARIEDVAHLPKDTAKLWSKEIPKYWTGPTIWSESIVKSVEAMGKSDLKQKINFKYLYAHLMVFNRSHREQIFSDFKLVKDINFYQFYIAIFLHRVSFFIKTRMGIVQKQYNQLPNIKEAISIIEKQIGVLKL